MERVTLRIPEQHIEEVEQLAEEGEYPNRSEAIRAGVRLLLEHEREKAGRRRRIGGQP